MSAITRAVWRRYFERVETEEPTVVLPTNVIDDENDSGSSDTNTNSSDNDEPEVDTRQEETISVPQGTDDDVEENSNNNNNSNDEYTFGSLEELEEELEYQIREARSFTMCSGYFLVLLWMQAFASSDPIFFLVSLFSSSVFLQYVDNAQERIDRLSMMVHEWEDDDDNQEDNRRRRNSRRRPSGVAEIVKESWDKFLFNSRASYIRKENFGEDSSKDSCSNNCNNKALFTIDDDDEEDFGCCLDCDATVESQKDDGSDGNTNDEYVPECSICLGEYEKGEEIVKLPCGHMFHTECIAQWTQHNKRCPLCNVDLSSDAAPSSSSSSTGDEMV